MMKFFKSFVVISLVVFALTSGGTVVSGLTVNSTNATVMNSTSAELDGIVCDKAGVFTASEVKRINDAAEKAFSKLGTDIYIVTAPTTSYWGDHFRADFNISSDCIILIISDNYAKNYNMYTYGNANRKISDSEFNKIVDASSVYNNIKSGKYADGAVAFIELSAKEYKTDWAAVITLGIVIGGITAIVVWFSVFFYYKRKMHSEKYPLSRYAQLDLKVKTDTFAGSFITTRVINHNTGGRGSSGGFRGGGGGGGGHRGGR